MKTRSVVALLAAGTMLAACDGLREALTAHTDVAARADSRELSVNRLSDLLGTSTLQIPVSKDVLTIVTDLWVNYQLLAVAAARGDSVMDTKLIDDATAGFTASARLRQYMESVSKTFRADSASETTYNQGAGGLFVARHILFPVPGGATQEQKDSVRRRAAGVRGQLTTANFAAMAKRYSSDPGSAQRGGDLGAFRPEDMVKPFSDAVIALQPGEISQPVETNHGYHLIQRPTYANARASYDADYVRLSAQRSESVFVANVDRDANIQVKSNAATVAKTAVREASQHRADRDVLASFKGGDLTVGSFLRWVESYPPNLRLVDQMGRAPDSLVKQFIKSVARNEVMLRRADSAGIAMSADEKARLYTEFKSILQSVWQQLGIHPMMLADSAKTLPERERVAAARVEAYLDRVMAGQAQPLNVPPPVQTVLRSKYSWKVYPAGVDRAVERAKKLRATADSARAAEQAKQPQSQVPLPLPQPDSAARRGTKRP